MTVADKIVQNLQDLPESAQAEVLDFVEFLKSKHGSAEDAEWSALSIMQALRGMDSEPNLYSEQDLKETF
jgi:hypothetical protein